MPSFKLPNDAAYLQPHDGGKSKAIRKGAFDQFNPSVLGLGDIKNESTGTAAVAAIFDLQGFTNFCKQMDPELSVPIYLSGFLNWIFAEIRKETLKKEYPEGIAVWHDLPFFTKFMGDGLLVLWNTSSMTAASQHNLVQSCCNILSSYGSDFLPAMRRRVTDPPPILRCGIARGTVYSVGNGNDYVGSCINVAARLQKLAGLPIAFTQRGFDPETGWPANKLAPWLLKKVSIRGIGENELVYVRKADLLKMEKKDKKLFLDP